MLDRLARRLLPLIERVAYHPFYNDPLTRAPRANANEYLQLWEHARSKDFPAIDAFEQQRAASIDRQWLDHLALRTQIAMKKSELCYQHGRLLYATVAALARTHDSVNIVETGTARGFSALCMAKALSDSRKAGKIVTFDVLPNNVAMYWNCIADHESGRQSRRQLLAEYSPLIDRYVIFHQGDTRAEMRKVDVPRVHLAFLDAVHTYSYVLAEFDAIRDRQTSGDVIFFDDYTTGKFDGVVRAVDEICERYHYQKQVIMAGTQRGYVIATKR